MTPEKAPEVGVLLHGHGGLIDRMRQRTAGLGADVLTVETANEKGNRETILAATGRMRGHLYALDKIMAAALAASAGGAESDPDEDDRRVPGLLKVEGSIGATLIPGTDYRVAEIREHHEPSGIEGEPPAITTVIRLDPVRAGGAESGPVMAWLIERGQPEGLDHAEWWGVTDSRTGAYGWVRSAFAADQFDTKGEAEAQIARFDLPDHPFRARAVQHGFYQYLRAGGAESGLGTPLFRVGVRVLLPQSGRGGGAPRRAEKGDEGLPSEDALAEALHEARRVEYPGARGPIAVEWRYMTIQDARLETPRVLTVLFTNREEARFPIAALPFSTSHEAVEVRILADGDVLDILSTDGDFRVTADELWGMLQGTLGGREVAAAVAETEGDAG